MVEKSKVKPAKRKEVDLCANTRKLNLEYDETKTINFKP